MVNPAYLIISATEPVTYGAATVKERFYNTVFDKLLTRLIADTDGRAAS